MTEDQLKQYYAHFGEAWQFMKTFLTRPDRKTDPDKYWKDVVDRYKAETNGEGEFIHKLYITAIRELERIDKEERKDD